jgi:hypothetical protein
MKTDFHAVKRQSAAHFGVDGFDQIHFDCAATDIRLICGDDQQKSGGLQFRTSFGNAGKNFKFGQISRRIWLAIARQRAIDDPVAIQKNGARARVNLNYIFGGHERANDE